ncbi:uncharacterized protein B0H18DRAFT_1116104 [Fomitopsis serialis]|uniref:uncharacterized protein n=1 Tax=Fomitopsis serialis TaxID=139415 RepID=UPI00200834DC|nr:uncharacterized protein B0H18DRAFT_1116104 [Neoantrodia serialis]KAH9931850.1 hypothetical protein B0H18DRAFT_1116104 [Neoantrodia serialis]
MPGHALLLRARLSTRCHQLEARGQATVRPSPAHHRVRHVDSRVKTPTGGLASARTIHEQLVCKPDERVAPTRARASTDDAPQAVQTNSASRACKTAPQDASTRAPKSPEDASANSKTSHREERSREADREEKQGPTAVSTPACRPPPSFHPHPRYAPSTSPSPLPRPAHSPLLDDLLRYSRPSASTRLSPAPLPAISPLISRPDLSAAHGRARAGEPQESRAVRSHRAPGIHPAATSLPREDLQALVRAHPASETAAAERAVLARARRPRQEVLPIAQTIHAQSICKSDERVVPPSARERDPLLDPSSASPSQGPPGWCAPSHRPRSFASQPVGGWSFSTLPSDPSMPPLHALSLAPPSSTSCPRLSTTHGTPGTNDLLEEHRAVRCYRAPGSPSVSSLAVAASSPPVEDEQAVPARTMGLKNEAPPIARTRQRAGSTEGQPCTSRLGQETGRREL